MDDPHMPPMNFIDWAVYRAAGDRWQLVFVFGKQCEPGIPTAAMFDQGPAGRPSATPFFLAAKSQPHDVIVV
jgi:hypothetical protein